MQSHAQQESPTIRLLNIRLGFLSQLGLLLSVPFQELSHVLCHWGANRAMRTRTQGRSTCLHSCSSQGRPVREFPWPWSQEGSHSPASRVGYVCLTAERWVRDAGKSTNDSQRLGCGTRCSAGWASSLQALGSCGHTGTAPSCRHSRESCCTADITRQSTVRPTQCSCCPA